MFVRLVLAGGSSAGTVAEIWEGYYLVGRHEECQIRPESDSVGERHCLLQHQGNTFRVVDLDSGHPTFVNHKPIAPKKWVLLNHGDMVRFGNLPFLVTITATDPSLPSGGKKGTSKQQQSGPKKSESSSRREPVENDFAMKDTAELDPEEVSDEISSDSSVDGPWKE